MSRKSKKQEAAAASAAPAAGPRRRTPAERQIRYARLLGMLFVIAGGTAIGFGWAGAARVNCIDCQMPYILSGGAGGLAALIFGVTLILIAQMRAEGLKLADRLEAANLSLRRLGPSMDGAVGAERVVAGRSTYHRPDCRLIVGKQDLESMSVPAAKANGLSPCRVCNPPDGVSVATTETLVEAPAPDGSSQDEPTTVGAATSSDPTIADTASTQGSAGEAST